MSQIWFGGIGAGGGAFGAGAASRFCTFSKGAILSNTTSHFSSSNSDITTITPIITPGILDQPIRSAILSSVSNNSDSMIDFCSSH